MFDFVDCNSFLFQDALAKVVQPVAQKLAAAQVGLQVFVSGTCHRALRPFFDSIILQQNPTPTPSPTTTTHDNDSVYVCYGVGVGRGEALSLPTPFPNCLLFLSPSHYVGISRADKFVCFIKVWTAKFFCICIYIS